MVEKHIRSRIQLKHALEKDWLKAVNFIPLKGEIIVYDVESSEEDIPESRKPIENTKIIFDRPRYKIGDGVRTISELPFSTEEGVESIADACIAHTEGYETEVLGEAGHAEGMGTISEGIASHAEGKGTQAVSDYSHAEGLRRASTDPRVTSGLRGFSIISTDYSDLTKCKVVLDSVEGIEKDYHFVYSTLEEAGSGLTRKLAWRPGAILVKVTAVDTSTNTITIESPLQYSASNTDITGNLEFSNGKANTSRFSITQKLLFLLIDYGERLASKIYFWQHPELGTSSISQGTHAEGLSTFALGQVAHSEGRTTLAIGDYAHTEGRESIVLAENGHAEGNSTLVSPTSTYAGNGHAEGIKTTARGSAAHAEGISANSARQVYFGSETSWSNSGYNEIRNSTPSDILTKWTDKNKGFLMANGAGAHAEGQNTLANATGAHAEGSQTLAGADTAHAEGYLTEATGAYSHAEGSNTAATESNAHAEGRQTIANAGSAHSEGSSTIASGMSSHAEGSLTKATNSTAHAEGQSTTASGAASHAEGYNTQATASHSHSEGSNTIASATSAHAEGSKTSAVGVFSHAEGASGKQLKDVVENITDIDEIESKWEESYSNGYGSSTFGVAFGANSHTEGRNAFAKGESSHAEGSETKAGDVAAHAEGLKAKAEGYASHAEGIFTNASGRGAHAEGNSTVASGTDQHVQGRYNVEDSAGTYAHIVGGGTSAERKNIHTLDWLGNASFAGSGEFNTSLSAPIVRTTKISNDDDLVISPENGGVLISPKYDNNNELTSCVHLSTNEYGHPKIAVQNDQYSFTEIDWHSVNMGSGSLILDGQTGIGTIKSNADMHIQCGANPNAYGNAPCSIYLNEATYINCDGSKLTTPEVVTNKISTSSKDVVLNIDAKTQFKDKITTNSDIETSANFKCGQNIECTGNIKGLKSIVVGTKLRNSSVNSSMFGISKTEVTDDVIANYVEELAKGQDATAQTKAAAMRKDWTAIANPWERFSFVCGQGANAVGRNTVALGASHAEGADTAALADGSHSEGYNTIAEGPYSHAEGTGTDATGRASHAEGSNTKAKAEASHAEGIGTIASLAAQHVSGRYNDEDNTKAVIVGWGTSSKKKNIYTLDTEGNAVFAGDITTSGIEIGNTRLNESILQNIIESTTSSSSQTFFETVECIGTYTVPEDALPYVKIEKLYSNNIDYSPSKNMQLEEYHDVGHYAGADLKLDVEPQEDNSVEIHIYGYIGGISNIFEYTPYDYKRYQGHYSSSFTTTLQVVDRTALPSWDYDGLSICLRSQMSTDVLLSKTINESSSNSYQITNAQIPYVEISISGIGTMVEDESRYIDVTLKMSCVPTTEYHYNANIDMLSDSSIADGTTADNFDFNYMYPSSNYYRGDMVDITKLIDYDDYFVPETGMLIVDGVEYGEINSNYMDYTVDDEYVYIRVTPGQTMKTYRTKHVDGSYRVYHDPALKWTMTIQRKVN